MEWSKICLRFSPPRWVPPVPTLPPLRFLSKWGRTTSLLKRTGSLPSAKNQIRDLAEPRRSGDKMHPLLLGSFLPPSYDAIRQINHVRALSGYSLPPSYDAIRQINHVRVLSAARSGGSAGPCVKAFPLLRPNREFPEPREIPHQIGNYKIRKRPICFFVLCFGFCLRPPEPLPW